MGGKNSNVLDKFKTEDTSVEHWQHSGASGVLFLLLKRSVSYILGTKRFDRTTIKMLLIDENFRNTNPNYIFHLI